MLHISIIGSGVIGQATGKMFARKGFVVDFYDTVPLKIGRLREEGFRAHTVDTPLSNESTIVFVCVPTPARRITGEPNLSALRDSLLFIGNSLKTRDTFVTIAIRSTVPVGTVQGFAIPLLEKISGKKSGEHFGVCSNPEYLREHSALEDSENPRMVVIGSDDTESARTLVNLYDSLGANISLLTTKEAEIHKYTHNLLNATKISFFNEQRLVYKKLSLDADKVFPVVVQTAEASWNPLYGIRDFGPFKGSCLPKDTRGFIAWTWRTLRIRLPLLSAVIQTNEKLRKHKKSALSRL